MTNTPKIDRNPLERAPKSDLRPSSRLAGPRDIPKRSARSRSAFLLTLALCSLSILDPFADTAEAQQAAAASCARDSGFSCSDQAPCAGRLRNDCTEPVRYRFNIRRTDDTCVGSSQGNVVGRLSSAVIGGSADKDGDLNVCVEWSDAQRQYNSGHASCGAVACPDENSGFTVFNAPALPTGRVDLGSGGITLDEGGSTGTLTVKLAASPPADVNLTVTSSDTGAVTVSPSTLTLTAADYSMGKTVTLTSVQDSDGSDESVTITVRVTSTLRSTQTTKTITVRDDDGGIDIEANTGLTLTEGTSGRALTVKLTAPPSSNTTVSITSGNTGVFTVSSPGSLTFTPSNYNTGQTINLTPVSDNDGSDSAVVFVTASIDGGAYRASNVARAIRVLDDDGSIDITPSAGISLTENGRADTFTVKLGAPPLANTVLTVTNSDPGAVTVSPATLTFTSNNHSTPQTVTLTPVRDGDDANETAIITLDVSSQTRAYRASSVRLHVSVADTRKGSIIVDRPQRTLSVNEGGSAIFTVRISVQPSAGKMVTIGLAKTNDDITLSPTSLTFDSSNWNVPKNITVSAAHDDDLDDGSDRITLSATGGGIDADDVVKVIGIMDDDAAVAIRVFDTDSNALAGAVVIDEGGQGSFSVSLSAEPSENVTIGLAKTNDDITLSSTSLQFTRTNWDAPQSVIVYARTDDDSDNDDDTITLSESGDLISTNATVRITVKEPPAGEIVIEPSPSAGAIVINEGLFDTLRVSLRLKTTNSLLRPPSTGVTLSLANTNDDLTLSPTRLSFNQSNWNVPRTVLLSTAVDNDDDVDTDTITLSASGAISASNATVDIVIDEVPRGLIRTLPPRNITIDEGEAGSFSVSLDTPGVGEDRNVAVVVTLSVINDEVTISPTQLTFADPDWDTPQNITVLTRHDDDSTNQHDIIVLNASGGIKARRGTLLVEIKDDDIPAGAIIMDDSEIVIAEGGLETFVVRLSEKPNDNERAYISLSKNSVGISLSSEELVFTSSNWNRNQIVGVEALQDDNARNESHTITLTPHGGIVSLSRIKQVRVIDDDEEGPDPIKSRALAFPALGTQDDATLRVRCNQNTPCTVLLDCSAQNDGSVFQGQLPGSIPAWGTRALDAAGIERAVGGSWSGRGRLGCALRSREQISSQVWTRSGNGVLVNNSASIRSVPEQRRYRADIESIPSPDEEDRSNLRIRCIAPAGKHCTQTRFSCFDDRGQRYEGDAGTIPRSTVRHLQDDELASMIDHRWSGMGLSCELRSDHPFTVQVLTRTGGGGALVNNSASGVFEP